MLEIVANRHHKRALSAAKGSSQLKQHSNQRLISTAPKHAQTFALVHATSRCRPANARKKTPPGKGRCLFMQVVSA